MQTTPGFHFRDASPAQTHQYLFPELLSILSECSFSSSSQHVFDLGCGNGSTAHALTQHGYSVTGVDPSQEGIRDAHAAYPELDLDLGSAYDNLAEQYGTLDVIINLEVIEHM